VNDEGKDKSAPVIFISSIHETPHLKEIALKHMGSIVEYIKEFKASKQNWYDSFNMSCLL
jgi:hypothetical protein